MREFFKDGFLGFGGQPRTGIGNRKFHLCGIIWQSFVFITFDRNNDIPFRCKLNGVGQHITQDLPHAYGITIKKLLGAGFITYHHFQGFVPRLHVV